MKVKQFIPALIVTAGLLAARQVVSQTNNFSEPGPHGWHHATADERLDRLAQELNLSDEQKTNVQAAFEDLRQRVDEARTNFNSQLQQILSPEQYQKLQDMHQHSMRPGNHQPGGGSGGE